MGGFVRVCGVRVARASGGARLLVAVMLGAFVLSGVPAAVSAQEEEEQEQQEQSDETEVLESANRTHTVERGDTLWDLAGFYLSDHFRWPSIYEINTTVIEDPHWIYPGEVFAIPLADAVAVADRLREDPLAETPDEVWDVVERRPAGELGEEGFSVSWFGGPTVFDTSRESRNVMGGLDIETYSEPMLVTAHDFYQAPMLVDRDEYRSHGRAARVIEGNPLNMQLPPGAGLRDLVIVDLGDVEVQSGDQLRAIRWQAGPRGLQMARSLAILEVTETDEGTARTVVTNLFGDFTIGDEVIPVEPFDVPSTLQQAVDDGALEAELIALEVEQALVSEGDMVFLDLGADDGVNVGDEFVFFETPDDAQAHIDDRLATVRIVRVDAEASTARVVDLHDASPERGSQGRRILRAVGS